MHRVQGGPAAPAPSAPSLPPLADLPSPTACLPPPCMHAAGDFQCNNAMAIFGKLKGKENAPKAPRDVSTAILAALPASDLIADCNIAGPGFINIKLKDTALAAQVRSMLTDGVAGLAPKLTVKRAVLDFSSPNVAKEMHVGHLRSTIIGDTLCRTLEFCGVDLLRLNHIGDWGTQFGMLIQVKLLSVCLRERQRRRLRKQGGTGREARGRQGRAGTGSVDGRDADKTPNLQTPTAQTAPPSHLRTPSIRVLAGHASSASCSLPSTLTLSLTHTHTHSHSHTHTQCTAHGRAAPRGPGRRGRQGRGRQ
jgi:hypothetical protein